MKTGLRQRRFSVSLTPHAECCSATLLTLHDRNRGTQTMAELLAGSCADEPLMASPVDVKDESVMHGIPRCLDETIIEIPKIEAFKKEFAARGRRWFVATRG